MTLSAGVRFGPFDVTGLLGEGGMPDAFAADAERVARFQREAELLATLTHPHIATIHGFEESAGTRALVLELVDGDTLADRIARGPLPMDEVTSLARQMAEALEYAHEHGVLHRDLKPANIKITADGQVKILDFGLAKAMEAGGAGRDTAAGTALANSPTITSPAVTRAGIILGTAAYMAPEQARGRVVDRRADIWAFGCVLYEMVTGRRAFAGEDLTDTLTAIMRDPPDWSLLPPDTPAGVRDLVSRCLVKDPRDRLRDIGEARLLLEGKVTPATAEGLAARPARRPLQTWMTAAAMVVAGVLGVAGGRLWTPAAAAPPTDPTNLRASIELPPGTSIPLSLLYHRPNLALSPDGQVLAFIAEPAGGPRRIFVRRLDAFDATPLAGTDDALEVFFAPDGRSIGFFTGDKVKKVSVDGGQVVSLSDARTPLSGSWPVPEWIYFSEREGRVLTRTPSGGGPAEEIATFDDPLGVLPGSVLPGGRAALLLVRRAESMAAYDVVVLDLQSKVRTATGLIGGRAQYVGSGHLLLMQGSELVAAPFDLSTLKVSGEPRTIVRDVDSKSTMATGQFAVADNGRLAYLPGMDHDLSAIVRVDRSGGVTPLMAPVQRYGSLEIDRSGTTVAVAVHDTRDFVYVFDLQRGEGRRLPGDRAIRLGPWVDARRLTLRFMEGPSPGVHVIDVDTGASEHIHPDLGLMVSSVSGDGQRMAVHHSAALTSGWAPLRPGTEITWFPIKGQAYLPVFAPDDNHVAYQADESGRQETWIRSLDGALVRQVSMSGGIEPIWTPNELVYHTETRWFSVRVRRGPRGLEWFPPDLLFDADWYNDPWGRAYATRDAQSFYMLRSTAPVSATSIRLVQDWTRLGTEQRAIGPRP